MFDKDSTRADDSSPVDDPGSRAGPTGSVTTVDSITTRGTSSPYFDTRGAAEITPSFDHATSAIVPGISVDAFPGFTLLEVLGHGGMGVVYKARQQGLNRLVALKVVLGGERAGPRGLIRFLAEAESIASIRHPNVVEVYEYGEADARPFLAMECLTGGSLADRLRRAGKLEPGAAADLLARLARGVHAAHEQGIIHRDLKPSNVLFNALGDPRITDFGLAKQARGSDLTRTQSLMGTPAYMSPEQAQGRSKFVGPAADVYALGVILYECLAGVRPFDEADTFVLLSRVVAEEPRSPRHHVPGLPRDLELIALKCLQKDPADRYRGADALAEDLRRFLAGEPILARPSSVTRKVWLWCRRNPLPASMAGALLATALVGSMAVGMAWGQAARERTEKSMIADYLSDRVLAEASTEVNPRGDRFTVEELLDRVGPRIGGDFQGHPEIEASIRETVGKAYLSLGEYAKAWPHLRAARALDEGLRGLGDPAALRVANLLAVLLEQSGRPDPAEALLRDNLAASRRWLGPDDPITLEASARLGALLRAAGKLDEAEPLIRSALEGRRRVLQADHPDTLRSVHDFCLLEVARRRFNAAAALADEYERGIRCARGPKHPDNVTAQANLGLIQLLRGRPDLAEPFYRKAADEARRILGDDHAITRAAVAEHARVAGDATLPATPPPVPTETPP
jgi:tRNA A-37 threonylcarbamoyl transferase component Bud32/tetratricopeptide (TPR) repeat protein